MEPPSAMTTVIAFSNACMKYKYIQGLPISIVEEVNNVNLINKKKTSEIKLELQSPLPCTLMANHF